MNIDINLHSESGRKPQNDDALAHCFEMDGFEMDGFEMDGFDIDGFEIDGFEIDGTEKNGTTTEQTPQQQRHGYLFIICDGVSAAEKGGVGSKTACSTFLHNYYKTPPNWRPQAMAEQLLSEINQRLYLLGTTAYGDGRKGYACTFSAVLIKGDQAHVFHIGDTRIYHKRGTTFTQITQDHSCEGPNGHIYLDNALGVEPHLQFDYHCIDIIQGDGFLLSSDGVHEVLDQQTLREGLDTFNAQALVNKAYDNGSADNLTSLMLTLTSPPVPRRAIGMLPNSLRSGETLDDLYIGEFLLKQGPYHYYHCHSRSNKTPYILKYPAFEGVANKTNVHEPINANCDNLYLEQWQLNKCHHPDICKPHSSTGQKTAHYALLECINHSVAQGSSCSLHDLFSSTKSLKPKRLVQWVEEILSTTLALKKLGLNHTALSPQNIFIKPSGELAFFCISLNLPSLAEPHYYASPEQILHSPSNQNTPPLSSNNITPEIYSCAVIMYEYLTAQAPYRYNMTHLKSKEDLHRLNYYAGLSERPDVPLWFDAALKKALSLYPESRYQNHTDFINDLLQPNTAFLDKDFIEQYSRKLPVFPLWKLISVLWGTSIIIMSIIVFD